MAPISGVSSTKAQAPLSLDQNEPTSKLEAIQKTINDTDPKISKLFPELETGLKAFEAQAKDAGNTLVFENFLVSQGRITHFALHQGSGFNPGQKVSITISYQDSKGPKKDFLRIYADGTYQYLEDSRQSSKLKTTDLRFLETVNRRLGSLKKQLELIDQAYQDKNILLQGLKERAQMQFPEYATLIDNKLLTERRIAASQAQLKEDPSNANFQEELRVQERALAVINENISTVRGHLIDQAWMSTQELDGYDSKAKKYEELYYKYQADYQRQMRRVAKNIEGRPPKLVFLFPGHSQFYIHEGNFYLHAQSFTVALRRFFNPFPEAPFINFQTEANARSNSTPMIWAYRFEVIRWAFYMIPKFVFALGDRPIPNRRLIFSYSSIDGHSQLTRLKGQSVVQEYRYNGDSLWNLRTEMRRGFLKSKKSGIFDQVQSHWKLRQVEQGPDADKARMEAIERYNAIHQGNTAITRVKVPELNFEQIRNLDTNGNFIDQATQKITHFLKASGIEYTITEFGPLFHLEKIPGPSQNRRKEIIATNTIGTCTYHVIQEKNPHTLQVEYKVQAFEGESLRTRFYSKDFKMDPERSGKIHAEDLKFAHGSFSPKSHLGNLVTRRILHQATYNGLAFGSMYLAQAFTYPFEYFKESQDRFPTRPYRINPWKFGRENLGSIALFAYASFQSDVLANNFTIRRGFNDLYDLKPIGNTFHETLFRRAFPIFALTFTQEFYNSHYSHGFINRRSFNTDRALHATLKLGTVSLASSTLLQLIQRIKFLRKIALTTRVLKVGATSAGPETLGSSLFGTLLIGALEMTALDLWEGHERDEFFRKMESSLRADLSLTIVRKNHLLRKIALGKSVNIDELFELDQLLNEYFHRYQDFLKQMPRKQQNKTSDLPLEQDLSSDQIEEFGKDIRTLKVKLAKIHSRALEQSKNISFEDFSYTFIQNLQTANPEISENTSPESEKTANQADFDQEHMDLISEYFQNALIQNPNFYQMDLDEQAIQIQEALSIQRFSADYIKSYLKKLQETSIRHSLIGEPDPLTRFINHPDTEIFREKLALEEKVKADAMEKLLKGHKIPDLLAHDLESLTKQMEQYHLECNLILRERMQAAYQRRKNL